MALKIAIFILICIWAYEIAAATPDAGGGLVECWEELNQLKSCMAEIVLFFLDLKGLPHISPDCCRTIQVLTHNCWPAMLVSLRFTPEEGYVLRSYCDASPAPAPATGPAAAAPLPGSPVAAAFLV